MAVIENDRRIRVLSTRISEELHNQLTAYAKRNRRSLASASRILVEDALRRALEEESIAP